MESSTQGCSTKVPATRDGALESFLSAYLQTTAAGGVLVSGFGIGSYHFASLLGRLAATGALRRFGERRVVVAAGLLAAAGLLTAVTAAAAAGAIGGLLVVGFAIAPVVPTTLSLAGRSAPGRSSQAVATTTAAGYGAFIVSPRAGDTTARSVKDLHSERTVVHLTQSDVRPMGRCCGEPSVHCDTMSRL